MIFNLSIKNRRKKALLSAQKTAVFLRMKKERTQRNHSSVRNRTTFDAQETTVSLRTKRIAFCYAAGRRNGTWFRAQESPAFFTYQKPSSSDTPLDVNWWLYANGRI